VPVNRFPSPLPILYPSAWSLNQVVLGYKKLHNSIDIIYVNSGGEAPLDSAGIPIGDSPPPRQESNTSTVLGH